MDTNKADNHSNQMDKPLPLWFMIILPLYIGGLLVLGLLPISGDWGWLEAWIFIISVSVNMSIGFWVINAKNPRVLRNRMKYKKEGLSAVTKKSAGSDWWVMPVMTIGFFGAMIFPAFEHRWGWPALPLWVAIIGAVLVNIGVLIINLAMLENAYASKILDIRGGQTLIDTGLYGRVRHPLYSGAIVMILATPISLGSLWALVPAVIAVLTLVVRIRYEEDMLVKGMDGYREYQQRVQFKLIPGIY